MGLAAPIFALSLIVAGYASGSSLLFGVLRPFIGTTCEWLGVQMTPTLIDIAAIAVFGCLALCLVMAVWRRSVPSYL